VPFFCWCRLRGHRFPDVYYLQVIRMNQVSPLDLRELLHSRYIIDASVKRTLYLVYAHL
jgi:hypothetical protein